MGRAAYPTEAFDLPAAARKEAEQREHEDDDQDDPENAQCSHLLPVVRRGTPTTAGGARWLRDVDGPDRDRPEHGRLLAREPVELLDDDRAELGAAVRPDLGERLVLRPPRPVGAIAGQRVECVGDE